MPVSAKSYNGQTRPKSGSFPELVFSAKNEIFSTSVSWFGIPEYIWNRWFLLPAHVLAAYCVYLTFTGVSPLSVLLFEIGWGYLGGLGITVGCHRFWSHKTFKAKLPLQYCLMVMQTISSMHPIYQWCLDHRIHHRYTDTEADPHNSKRGFWYCHIGWLLVPPTKEYLEKTKSFDMPDLENDPVVQFQQKHYGILSFLFRYAIPVWITYSFWEMTLFHSVCSFARQYVVSRHFTWSVNSFAHMFGDKPYDKNISSAENALVSFLAAGEGWHNYHHTFPWDYKASEFAGWKHNPSTMVIDFCASMGWAYDLKTVSQNLLQRRLARTGDSDRILATGEFDDAQKNKNDFEYTTPKDVSEWMQGMEKPVWGWDDQTLPDKFREVTRILSPR